MQRVTSCSGLKGVQGLGWSEGVNEEVLSCIFQNYAVSSLQVSRDPITNGSLCYGFVRFKTLEEA